MRRTVSIISAVIVLGIAVYLISTMNLFSENNKGTPDGVSQATADRYQEKEIRDYQGVRLDPAIGPRDNSIAGIQTVALDSYQLKLTGLVETPVSFSYDQVLAKAPE
ncbi:hypothetical protein [Acetobacterium wieringae]|uniref:hypothetical protein n=1 Tax=Acetobacterium wieringae TaxID=52694 RepID=UPI0026F0DCBF|nr:hypothetical protein [Acetobacterium wieringae]